jgi:hypothetical protein
MKLKLRIAKHGAVLYTGAYDISDADSFAKACADAWHNLEREQAAKEPSIGALMEHLHSGALDQIIGANINFDRA